MNDEWVMHAYNTWDLRSPASSWTSFYYLFFLVSIEFISGSRIFHPDSKEFSKKSTIHILIPWDSWLISAGSTQPWQWNAPFSSSTLTSIPASFAHLAIVIAGAWNHSAVPACTSILVLFRWRRWRTLSTKVEWLVEGEISGWWDDKAWKVEVSSHWSNSSSFERMPSCCWIIVLDGNCVSFGFWYCDKWSRGGSRWLAVWMTILVYCSYRSLAIWHQSDVSLENGSGRVLISGNLAR